MQQQQQQLWFYFFHFLPILNILCKYKTETGISPIILSPFCCDISSALKRCIELMLLYQQGPVFNMLQSSIALYILPSSQSLHFF